MGTHELAAEEWANAEAVLAKGSKAKLAELGDAAMFALCAKTLQIDTAGMGRDDARRALHEYVSPYYRCPEQNTYTQ